MEIAAEILTHYAEGQEHARLTSRPSLELLRTRVPLERFLPAAPARVLDMGGARVLPRLHRHARIHRGDDR